MLEAPVLVAAANCAAVDADLRAFCFALQRRSSAASVAIADYALRQQCSVELDAAGRRKRPSAARRAISR